MGMATRTSATTGSCDDQQGEVGLKSGQPQAQLPQLSSTTSSKSVFPFTRGVNACEQRFSYRQHELYDEDVPSDDEEGRTETESLSFLVVGDQNAGKSTFLHSFSNFEDSNFMRLQSFLPAITSTFRNQCFTSVTATANASSEDARQAKHDVAAGTADEHESVGVKPDHDMEGEAQLVQGVARVCDEPPYLDTDLGTATVLLTAENFSFFLREFELEETVRLADSTRFVQIRFHEIGGDHLDRLMVKQAEEERKKNTITGTVSSSISTSTSAPHSYLLSSQLRESLRVLKKVTRLVYFVNARSFLENPKESLATLKRRLTFLSAVCEKASDVQFYCSRTEEHQEGRRLEELGLQVKIDTNEEQSDDEDQRPPHKERRLSADRSGDEAFHNVPSTEAFSDEYGRDKWQAEKLCIQGFHSGVGFQKVNTAIWGLFSRTSSRSCDTRSGEAAQEALKNLRCTGVFPTRNLDSEGHIAVCSVLIALIRLLVSVGKTNLDGANFSNLPNSSNIMSTTSTLEENLPEFVELFVSCHRYFRETSGEMYLSEAHWRKFLEEEVDAYFISGSGPDVPFLWEAGVSLYQKRGLVVCKKVVAPVVEEDTEKKTKDDIRTGVVVRVGGRNDDIKENDVEGDTFNMADRHELMPESNQAEKTTHEIEEPLTSSIPFVRLPAHEGLFELLTCEATRQAQLRVLREGGKLFSLSSGNDYDSTTAEAAFHMRLRNLGTALRKRADESARAATKNDDVLLDEQEQKFEQEADLKIFENAIL
ncbi:unnamed protein product [Amoebophrya sp. A25]|nr:unnamed protein product [Amoebophrya sp. A25]|eukprot:GSA25T00012677001.1